jgi:hypothetical protein
MRKQLESTEETIPNQINQPTSVPTLRWVFQLLEGIHQVSLDVDGQVTSVMEGITELRGKILQLFGKKVSQIYYISKGFANDVEPHKHWVPLTPPHVE